MMLTEQQVAYDKDRYARISAEIRKEVLMTGRLEAVAYAVLPDDIIKVPIDPAKLEPGTNRLEYLVKSIMAVVGPKLTVASNKRDYEMRFFMFATLVRRDDEGLLTIMQAGGEDKTEFYKFQVLDDGRFRLVPTTF